MCRPPSCDLLVGAGQVTSELELFLTRPLAEGLYDTAQVAYILYSPCQDRVEQLKQGVREKAKQGERRERVQSGTAGVRGWGLSFPYPNTGSGHHQRVLVGLMPLSASVTWSRRAVFIHLTGKAKT
jgi:hypothetical protein